MRMRMRMWKRMKRMEEEVKQEGGGGCVGLSARVFLHTCRQLPSILGRSNQGALKLTALLLGPSPHGTTSRSPGLHLCVQAHEHAAMFPRFEVRGCATPSDAFPYYFTFLSVYVIHVWIGAEAFSRDSYKPSSGRAYQIALYFYHRCRR